MNIAKTDKAFRPVMETQPQQARGPGVSVIIPAFNCSRTIVRTLASVDRSIAFCEHRLDGFKAEVVIVIDNATDDTCRVVEEYAADRSGYRIIRNRRNRGAGPSRNKGVRNSKGELIFFLDGDDIFFEDHIHLCVYHLMNVPQVLYARTQVQIQENIHPLWQKEIERSLPINICVRRWCHEFIGGFYEEDAFRTCTCEDYMYRDLLKRFCPVLQIGKATVQHFRYPGNALDRQMQKFSSPPDAGLNSLSPSEKAVMPDIFRIHARRIETIKNRLTHWINFLGASGAL